MSFLDILNDIDLLKLKSLMDSVTSEDVDRILHKSRFGIKDLPVLLSPAAADFLEPMAAVARKITLLRFGKTIKLYAPLYISNECVNACAYCGFNRNNHLDRKTLTREEVFREAEVLYSQGFRHILLVSGEDRKSVPVDFLEDIIAGLALRFAAVSIEVYPMSGDEYERLCLRGAVGIALYQETYNRQVYESVHDGPKADFAGRLKAIEDAADAGFRELGIGVLLGLSDFSVDMYCTGLHAVYLMKRFWMSSIAVSFPRLREAEGNFKPHLIISDRQLAQAIFAFRMVLPDADLVLSTRESPGFRDGMAEICVTRMSAGSKTNPGGYSVADKSLKQFEILDKRTPEEITTMLQSKNIDPVWKDFDSNFCLG